MTHIAGSTHEDRTPDSGAHDSDMRDRRADIARRSRHRAADARDRRVALAMFGLTAYQGASHLIVGMLVLTGLDAIVAAVFGVLFGFAAYRIWMRDDLRWWVPALPAILSLFLGAFVLAAGHVPAPVPVLLNLALLALIPMRRRTSAAASALAPAAPSGAALAPPARA